jgi:hypothetical protein
MSVSGIGRALPWTTSRFERTRDRSGTALGAGLLTLGAGVVSLRLFRCPHRKMSWPIRQNGHAYQVCLDWGIKRLFDETQFRAYGR